MKKLLLLSCVSLLSCKQELPHKQYVNAAKTVTRAIDYTQAMLRTHLEAFDEMAEKIGDTSDPKTSLEMLDVASGCENGVRSGLGNYMAELEKLPETDARLQIEKSASAYAHHVDSVLSGVLPYFTNLKKMGMGPAERLKYNAIKQALNSCLKQGEELNLQVSSYMQQHKVASTEIVNK